MKIQHYLREEKQARQLCRELIKNKLVIID